MGSLDFTSCARRAVLPFVTFEAVKEVSNAWQTMNDEMIGVDTVAAQDPEIGRVLRVLGEQLAADQFIDFSTMIRLAVEALQEHQPGAERATAHLRHLMVDEYQDVNPAQECLVRELHARLLSLFVVGDDDQAIYSWRGADVGNILGFQDRYPGCSVHTLAHNFRSTPTIVAVAESFAAAELGPTRIAKNPTATVFDYPCDFRKLWFATRRDEANWVAGRIAALLGTAYTERDGAVRGLTPGDFAILMRSTRTAEKDESPRHAAFTQALEARGIRYSLEAGGGVFERPQVRALADTFTLLRAGPPTRQDARQHFDNVVRGAFPRASFDRMAQTLADWGRRIHEPAGGPRRRVFPQQLVHDLLSDFGLAATNFDSDTMRDLGVFSRIMQDVEAVYLSIDTAQRFTQILNFLENVAENGYDASTDEILRRPDDVMVSTVHKVKGLEFPVVFIVDVEAVRFPSKHHAYSGWLPQALIQAAIARGAYQGTRDQEARLFYTALTRAERFLHVSGSESLPGGTKRWARSPFSLRLVHTDISEDSNGLPPGLVAHAPVPRIDESVVPTSYSDIRYFLRCPRDYQFRKSFGFSPSIPELFGFGRTVHTSIGKLHELFPNRAPTAEEAEEASRDIFHLKHVAPSRDPQNRPGAYERARDSAARISRTYAESHAADFTQNREIEVRFEIPVEQAVIAGSIDLLLRINHAGEIIDASVIDFKTMEGGPDPENNEEIQWTELALQVQLYAKASREVLGEQTRTGAVHLLKDNQRVAVPVTDEAVDAAVANVEWAVNQIIRNDFPMRPHPEKCESCDFKLLCPKRMQEFVSNDRPPAIHIPGRDQTEMARAFSQFARVP
jgi:DNA helicase-2/ATP-dependent DNA helicase PcrA